MLFIGIDPGLAGAIAWMDEGRRGVEIHDCPVLKLATGKTQYRKLAMAEIIRQATSRTSQKVVVALEGNHPAPHAGGDGGFSRGAVASFGLGRGGGIWEGILAALDITPLMPSPESWKRQMLLGLGKGKVVAVEHAVRLFPDQRHVLYGPKGGPLDGRAEALLLAEFARRSWKLTGGR